MNILELKGKNLPDWYFEKAICPNDIPDFQFYYLYKYEFKKIKVPDIVGTYHENYYRKTWLQILSSLPRYQSNFDAENIKQIVLKKDGKSVSEYSGKFYIEEGNHRLTHAKFLEIEEVYCHVNCFKFNKDDFDCYLSLLNNGFSCNYRNGSFFNILLRDIHITISHQENKYVEKKCIHKMIDIFNSVNIRYVDFLFGLFTDFELNSPVFVLFCDNDKSYNEFRKALTNQKLREVMSKNEKQFNLIRYLYSVRLFILNKLSIIINS